MKLIINDDYTIATIANQITQSLDNIKLLEKYTKEQLLLAEENSTNISTSIYNNSILLRYTFSDKSTVSFLIKPTL